jgi:uncharacterized RDD family membrane protein YckC
VDTCPSCGSVVSSSAGTCPACGAELPASEVAKAAPVGEGALQFSHSGSRFLLGFGRDHFGIWDRQAPGPPIERFARTDEGWREAWLRYSAIEPTWVEVGMGAASRSSPGGGRSIPPGIVTEWGTVLASPWVRLGARVVDGLILAAVFTVLVAGGAVRIDLTRGDGIPRSFLVMALVVGGIYETGFIALRGQTPGKMVFRAKVVKMEDGSPPGLSRALTRWVLPAVASLIPLGALLVYAWLLWDRRRQGLHDKVARTLVVSTATLPARGGLYNR